MTITKTAHFMLTVVSIPDFSLILPSAEGEAFAGQKIAIVAQAESIDQFAGDVKFSISGQPAGSVVTFVPVDTVTIAPGLPKSVMIEIAIPADNSLVGVYDITISAESTSYNGQ